MQDEDYRLITDAILSNREFNKLKSENHHVTCSRYDHVVTVSQYTYYLAKMLKMDTISATRAALLHDFFYNSKSNKKDVKTLVSHPEIALINARKHFEINEMEANIITSHMYPFCKSMPKYKESWLVNIVDNFVSFIEYGYRLRRVAQIAMVLLIKF